jgi:hypothetical protein
MDDLTEEQLAQIMSEMYDNDEIIEKITKPVKISSPLVLPKKQLSSPISISDSISDISLISSLDSKDEKNKKYKPAPIKHGMGFPLGVFHGGGHILGDTLSSGAGSSAYSGEIPEVLMTKIVSNYFVCMESKRFFKNRTKEMMKFDKSDGIILSKEMGERFMSSSMNLYSIKITGDNTKIDTFGRVIGFDAPNISAVMPKWMMEQLMLKSGDKIYITSMNSPKITSMTVSLNGFKIENPTRILEYEMRDHSISYVGKCIKVKMFEKEIVMTIVKQEPAFVGVIIGSDINIEFEK